MSSKLTTRYNEIQISSEILDQAPCPVRTKIFICSTPRTGSTLLCRAMIHHGIGIPHEYYHYAHAAIIGPRLGIDALRNGYLLQWESGLRRAYINEVINRRTVNGIFSAKIQWWEFATYLDNQEGIELLQNAQFIYLYREDLLAQAISLHVSHQTGRWGFDDLVTTVPESNPNFLDVDTIDAHLDEISTHDMNWRLFFARNQILPLIFSYEQLVNDLTSALRSMVDAFSLELSTKRLRYAEETSTNARDARVPPFSEIKAHYLRARQQVIQAPRLGKKTHPQKSPG